MRHPTELLTARELAKQLRVCHETIHGWARTGRIPSIRVNSKVVRFDPSAIRMALGTVEPKGVRREL